MAFPSSHPPVVAFFLSPFRFNTLLPLFIFSRKQIGWEPQPWYRFFFPVVLSFIWASSSHAFLPVSQGACMALLCTNLNSFFFPCFFPSASPGFFACSTLPSSLSFGFHIAFESFLHTLSCVSALSECVSSQSSRFPGSPNFTILCFPTSQAPPLRHHFFLPSS